MAQPLKEHTMLTLDNKSSVPHKLRSASASTVVALGVLAAIAISVLVLALTGANRNAPTSSATKHPIRTSTSTRPVDHRGAGRCHAVLNPMTGELHGGCSIASPAANTPTPAP
jgi:hypothetical protein